MNRVIKILFVFFLAGWFSGCAMKEVYNIAPDKVVGSVGGVTLTIEDNRPKDETKKSYGSFIIGASDYGIWTLGDESFTPPPMEVLRQRVLESVSHMTDNKPQNIRLNVKHLVVQDNQQAYLLKSGSEQGGLGPLGVAIAEAMHGQKFEFDADKTKPFLLALLHVEVEIDGKTKNVMFNKSANYRSNTDTEGRDKATRKVSDEFFSELGKIIIN